MKQTTTRMKKQEENHKGQTHKGPKSKITKDHEFNFPNEGVTNLFMKTKALEILKTCKQKRKDGSMLNFTT